MDEHKHNQKDFKDFLKNLETEKSGDLDDFEREALEGFATLDSAQEAEKLKSDLDKKIYKELFTEEKKKRPIVYWFAAAGLALVIGLSVVLIKNNQTQNNVATVHEKDIVNLEKEAVLSPPSTSPSLNEESEKKEEKVTVETYKSNRTGKSAEAEKAATENTSTTEIAKSFSAPKEETNTNRTNVYREGGEGIKVNDESTVKQEESEKPIVSGNSNTDFKTTDTEADDAKKIPADKLAAKDYEENQNRQRKEKKGKNTSKAKKTSSQTEPANEAYPGYYDGNLAKNDKPETKSTAVPATSPAGTASGTYAAPESETYGYNSPENSCYYRGGKEQLLLDLRTFLADKNIHKRFDVILSINEKKLVSHVLYLNVYDLTKEEQKKVSEALKSLKQFDFYIQPTKKSQSEYKLEYKP